MLARQRSRLPEQRREVLLVLLGRSEGVDVNPVVRCCQQALVDEALAAVLGGTQSLHCNGKDEALALPTEESATLALRTQQIILHESGAAATVDPIGGAYAIEEMTNRIEQDAVALLEHIQSMGGTLAAIESGFLQRQIQDSAYLAQQALDTGAAVMVGVNHYVDATPRSSRVFQIDPHVEWQQVERVRALRASRSESDCRAALDAVERAARSSDNLVPPIIAAVEQRATLGEVANTLRRVFGEHRETST